MQDKAKTGRAYHMQDKAKTGHAHYMRNKAEMEQVPYMKEKTETGQRKTEKKREGKKQKKIQKTKERKERTAKKEAAGPGMFLIAGGIFAIVLAGAAAWMWGMDTTQIGGVVFVLAGILIYGCRLDGREKKKKKNDDSGMESWEREADLSYEGWKEADGFCEWEKEGGKEGCPGAGKSDGGWNTASVPPEFSVREQRDRQYNLHGGHLAGETGSRRQQLGDTGVLYEDGPSYAPTPVLVSADPRRSESMVLTDNSYTVGKLAAQSDIVLDHPSVSRVHAKIEKWDGEYYVHDLNSTNGTFINGRRLDIHESVPIYPGDEIFFAKVGFHVGRC
ncbi:MAG: FHA domain-containing protein, partial [Eubacteriales bacterium]|nr:FHA domain-containing protein [Eubacteriales bacterium]